MKKENVLEIEYQDVFDKVAVRIKYLNDDFFSGGLLKEDVEKYNCSFIKNPADLEERIIWLYGDIYLSDNDIYCYCKETINKIKEFVDYVNEEYGITKRWRAEENEEYYFLDGKCEIWNTIEEKKKMDKSFFELGNYFKTREEAEKVKIELDKFWEKVRAGEIGGENVEV